MIAALHRFGRRFYEWKTEDGRQPYRIMLVGNKPFVFARVWKIWTAEKSAPDHAADEAVETFCILTTAANAKLQAIYTQRLRSRDRESAGVIHTLRILAAFFLAIVADPI